MASKRILLVVLMFAVCALVGCGKPAKKAAGPAETEGKAPYVIGAIFSTTGPAAPLGVPEDMTVKMLEKKINDGGGIDGHPIEVEVYDDQGKPEEAKMACEKLLGSKDVVAIIGPTLSGTSLTITQMCQDAGMPLVSCAASVKIVEPVKPYVFKTAQTDSLAVTKLLDYLTAKGIKTVAFINDSNAFGQSGREQWGILSKAAGIKTVAEESFGTNDTNVTPQLTKIKAKNPGAVVCWGTNPGPAILAKDMRKLGMKQPLFMSHGVANKTFIELAQDAGEGVMFPAGKLLIADVIPDTDPRKEVLLAYAADFPAANEGRSADTFGGHAYDALMLVVDALTAVGPDKAKMRDHLEGVKDFKGISGVFNFSPTDHAGLTKDAFAFVEIKGGKWVPVEMK